MSGKSKQYWIARWNQFPGDCYDKAKNLLLEYSGSFRRVLIFDYVWGGSIGRFFKGRWNTHHGDIVQQALHQPFANNFASIVDNDLPETLTFNLLKQLEQNLGGATLKPDGDLSVIMSVIREETTKNENEKNPNQDAMLAESSKTLTAARMVPSYGGEDF